MSWLLQHKAIYNDLHDIGTPLSSIHTWRNLILPRHYSFDTAGTAPTLQPTHKPTKNTDNSSDVDMHNTNWNEIDISKFAVSLMLFSTLENAVFYPFSVLKTREQSDHTKLTPLQSFKHHVSNSFKHQHGIRNVYKGFWFSSFANYPAFGAYMAIYTAMKQQLGYVPGKSVAEIGYLGKFAPLIAGATADVASVVLFVPADVITQRLQLVNGPYANARQAFKDIVKRDGYRGLFVGLNATLITSTIGSAVWWQTYEMSKSALYNSETVKRLYWPNEENGSVNRWPQAIAGFIAGEVTSVLVNPLDVVKTRLQTQATMQDTGTKQLMYTGTLTGLKQLWQHEGFSGLTRGVLPKMLSRGPLSALTSLTYEFILYFGRKDVHIW